MKVMVLIKATANSEAGVMPDASLLAAMGRYNEALMEAGVLAGGDGLKPSRVGKRVRFVDDERLVFDGPFAETKELIAGYWIWEVSDMDHAIGWARKCPNPMPGEQAELEIRPIYGLDDFAEAFTPESRAREEGIREALAEKGRDG